MQRKKVSTGTNNAAAVIDLDDDEQLVEEVTTTKRIGRQRRSPPAAEEVIDAEIIEPDDGDDDADDAPEFGDNTLAAAIFGDNDQSIENQYCTVAIRRTPDSMNDHFLNGCGSIMNLPPMRNVELTAEKMDIEDRVRAEYGGGHYFFQIRYNDRLATSWKATLGDDAHAIAAAKTATAATAIPVPAAAVAIAPPVDPMDSFLDNLEKQKRMRDLLFGDAERQLKDEIAQLRAEAARPQPPAPPQSDTLVILEKALAAGNPDITERLLEYAFPSGDKEPRHWLADAISVVMENKDAIGGMLGGLLGGVAPPAGPPNIADLMKMQPPPNALGPGEPAKPREIFKRTAAEPPPELKPDPELSTAETPMSDRDAIDAEPVIEATGAKPAKAARGKAK